MPPQMVAQRLTMSAVSNTHKINGNLIANADATVQHHHMTVTTAAGSTTQTTFLHTNPNPSLHHQPHQLRLHNQQHPQHQQQQQLEHSPNSLRHQHNTNLKTSSSSAIGLGKLQAPHHHQRRSLIPSATLPQQGQQQSITVTTSTASATAGNQPPQPNQLQTVATIHQPSSQPQQFNTTIQSSAAISQPAQTSTTSGATEHPTNPNSRRSFHHFQSLKSTTNLKAPAHSIPPRYQPPPQPNQQQHTGILKNLNSQRFSNGTKSEGQSSYFSESSGGSHIANLKYPPDIPQLSTVYIPDSLNNPANNGRYLQQKQQHLLSTQPQFPPRLRNSNQQTSTSVQQSKGILHNSLLNGHQSLSATTATDPQQQDMLKFVRKSDQEHPSPNASVGSSGTGGIPTTTGRLTAEQNRQLQSLISELRSLKEQNQRLMDDNQELRDLCCFLDDDRQKGRKLAREWQRFGRYTASVMRQEVAAYQNKLRQLDDKQQELITDNLELKELCLYLDEERAHIAANSLCVNCGASNRNALRDDGDGSSSSTNADENMTALRTYDRQLPDLHLRSTLQDQTLQYVRSLERRIQQLEEERNSNEANTTTPAKLVSSQLPLQHSNKQQQPLPHQHLLQQQHLKQQQQPQPTNVTTASTNHQSQKLITATTSASTASADNDGIVDPISGRPEAVVRALQVLEVREQLERDRLGNLTGNAIDQMDDGEKALVREMCNVVWRKLEGSPNGPATMEPL